jgi:hypothetical protein
LLDIVSYIFGTNMRANEQKEKPLAQSEDQAQRCAAAYHEAGHAIVGYTVGWWINDEGVEIGQRQYTGLRCYPEYITTDNQVAVDLAGWLAEFKWHGRGGLFDDEELIFAIEDARLDNSDELSEADGEDNFYALDRLLRDDPDATDIAVLAQYRMHQRRIIKLLDDPDVWRAIETIANLLIESGKIHDDDVRRVARDASLIC